MEFKLLSIFLVLITFTGCATLNDRSVNVTEAQLQQKINERLAIPISLLKIFDVSLSNSSVKFDKQTGRMQTTLDTNVKSLLSDKVIAGKLDISGKLRFDVTTSSIVLDEPKVESLNLNGSGGKYGDLINVLAQKLGGDLLNGMTLYTIKPEDLNYRGTQYNPKDLQVTDRGLQMMFSPVR